MTQERRERLTAALPDEHFAINDVKRVLVRLFPELHINEHRESDGYSRRPRNDHTGPSSAYQKREQTSYPRRYRCAPATGHEWVDTDSVDGETDVNSADLQGFVRSELEALSAGIDDFPSDLLVTIRGARDKMKGKSEGQGEPAVSFPGKGKGRWRKPQRSQTFAGQVRCEKVEINVSRVWTTRSLGWGSSMPWKSRHKFHYLAR